jgi:50S ribosomal protein L16 3-hydroxylase
MTTPLTHLGDMPIEEFLRDYWQKKPLLIRNAFPDFESPISPDELAGLALEEEVESRIVLEKGATPWDLRNGPFDDKTLDIISSSSRPVCAGSKSDAGCISLYSQLAPG